MTFFPQESSSSHLKIVFNLKEVAAGLRSDHLHWAESCLSNRFAPHLSWLVVNYERVPLLQAPGHTGSGLVQEGPLDPVQSGAEVLLQQYASGSARWRDPAVGAWALSEAE